MPIARKHDIQVAVEPSPRRRILDAAFAAFSKDGYAATSTLEIATRAKVSKRELYAVGNKQELLLACITERAARFAAPTSEPAPQDRESLERVLALFGEQQLRELADPNVVAMFRLAIAEAERAPEIAQALDAIARAANRARLRAILDDGRAKSLLVGPADEMSDVFRSLLFGDVMVTRLLGAKSVPHARDLKQRAQRAAGAILKLYAG